MTRYKTNETRFGGFIIINYSDGTNDVFNALELTKEWFNMSNDGFFEKYGFNFNPHNYPGLYEAGRRAVFENENKMQTDFLRPLC